MNEETINMTEIRLGLKNPDGTIISTNCRIDKKIPTKYILPVLAENMSDIEVLRYHIEYINHATDKNEEEFLSHGDKYNAYLDGNEWNLILKCGNGKMYARFGINVSEYINAINKDKK